MLGAHGRANPFPSLAGKWKEGKDWGLIILFKVSSPLQGEPVLRASLLLGIVRGSRLTLYIPGSVLESSFSPSCSGSCWWRMEFRSQELGAGYVHCSWWDIVGRPAQQKRLHGEVCVCRCLFHIGNHDCTKIAPAPPVTKSTFRFTFSTLATPFSPVSSWLHVPHVMICSCLGCTEGETDNLYHTGVWTTRSWFYLPCILRKTAHGEMCKYDLLTYAVKKISIRGWWSGSSGREPASQPWGPEFKP
jgi:hypothetical protein